MVSKDIRVDGVLYDTVPCTVFIMYDTEIKEIAEVYLMSNLSCTGQALLSWKDIGQYGACCHICETWELSQLMECIKDKDWTWTTQNGAMDIERSTGNIPQTLKEELLEKMRKK